MREVTLTLTLTLTQVDFSIGVSTGGGHGDQRVRPLVRAVAAAVLRCASRPYGVYRPARPGLLRRHPGTHPPGSWSPP